MSELYLVISLARKVIIGVFATKQEAERYVDIFDKGYRNDEYVIVVAQIGPDGKIVPDTSLPNDYDDDEEPSWISDYLGIKDELNELK